MGVAAEEPSVRENPDPTDDEILAAAGTDSNHS